LTEKAALGSQEHTHTILNRLETNRKVGLAVAIEVAGNHFYRVARQSEPERGTNKPAAGRSPQKEEIRAAGEGEVELAVTIEIIGRDDCVTGDVRNNAAVGKTAAAIAVQEPRATSGE
jgi:hypothetical protein